MEVRMFDCTCHGHVPAKDGKCSYCEAGWTCIKHGPYDPTGYRTLQAHYKMTPEERLLGNGCPTCYEERHKVNLLADYQRFDLFEKEIMTDTTPDFFCERHGWTASSPYCQYCGSTALNKPLIATPSQPVATQRKYLPTLAELVDRLTITQLKEVKIPQHKEEYSKEIEDIVHDIQILLNESDCAISAQTIRDIIVLAQMNTHIWVNETNFRNGKRDGNDLELTHGLNGIRNTAKNKIQEVVGGRKDYKIDNVKAFKDWVPSGYDKKED